MRGVRCLCPPQALKPYLFRQQGGHQGNHDTGSAPYIRHGSRISFTPGACRYADLTCRTHKVSLSILHARRSHSRNPMHDNHASTCKLRVWRKHTLLQQVLAAHAFLTAARLMHVMPTSSSSHMRGCRHTFSQYATHFISQGWRTLCHAHRSQGSEQRPRYTGHRDSAVLHSLPGEQLQKAMVVIYSMSGAYACPACHSCHKTWQT